MHKLKPTWNATFTSLIRPVLSVMDDTARNRYQSSRNDVERECIVWWNKSFDTLGQSLPLQGPHILHHEYGQSQQLPEKKLLKVKVQYLLVELLQDQLSRTER